MFLAKHDHQYVLLQACICCTSGSIWRSAAFAAADWEGAADGESSSCLTYAAKKV